MTPALPSNGFLLDTHALYYLDSDPSGLVPRPLLSALSAAGTQLYVSSLSAWEMGIKHQTGKWPEVAGLLGDYHATLVAYGCNELAFTGAAALIAAQLPALHKDPFDRGLIGQALAHGLTLVSEDALVYAYSGVVPGLRLRWS